MHLNISILPQATQHRITRSDKTIQVNPPSSASVSRELRLFASHIRSQFWHDIWNDIHFPPSLSFQLAASPSRHKCAVVTIIRDTRRELGQDAGRVRVALRHLVSAVCFALAVAEYGVCIIAGQAKVAGVTWKSKALLSRGGLT